MKEFKVLPTNKDFLALTEQQIEFIAYSMEKDQEELARARKGRVSDSEYQDYDDSWWTASHDEFTALRSDHDEEEIARQVQDMTTAEDMAKLRARWDASVEADDIIANGGTTIAEDNINDFLKNKLDSVLKEAQDLQAKGINKWGDKTDLEVSQEQHQQKLGMNKLTEEGISEAISIFEDSGNNNDSGVDPTLYIPGQEDDFYI